MPRWLTAVFVCGLLTVWFAPRCHAEAVDPQLASLSCASAILTMRKTGDQLLAEYQDGRGHRIDLWCTRGIVTSQYDLRVGALTVGGCFFAEGHNHGPIIVRDSDGAFAKVEWINENPTDRSGYRFSYDFATRLVTITATEAGCPSVTKIVSPQPSFAKMDEVLPDLSNAACAQSANVAAPTP